MRYGWRGWQQAAQFDNLREALAWREILRQLPCGFFFRQRDVKDQTGSQGKGNVPR
jgi:hypothetical protein